MSSACTRAVLLATGAAWEKSGDALAEQRFFLDRPFGHHVLETLVNCDIQKVDVVVHHRPEAIEAAWGDGSRWGIRIDYHLVREAEHPFQALLGLDLHGDEGVLLGRADSLPTQQSLQELFSKDERTALLVSRREKAADPAPGSWTGWAWIPAAEKTDFPVEGESTSDSDWIWSGEEGASVTIHPEEILDARTPEAFLESMHLVLGGKFQTLLKTGREVEAGIRLGKNAKVHPSAVVQAPVYLGEDCWIGPGARIGPFATLGRGSIVGKNSSVVRSVVEPGSYVGEGLSLHEALVDRSRLIDTALGVTVELTDQLLLGSVTRDGAGLGWSSVLSRGVAALAVTFLSPVLLFTALVLKLVRPGPVLFRREVVKPSGGQDRARDRTIRLFTFDPGFGTAADRLAGRSAHLADVLLRFLPGLVNVAKGELCLVGLEPRSPGSLASLPSEWQEVYRGSDIGLVTEAEVRQGPNPDPDHLFVSEAYYSALRSPGHKLRLLLAFLLGRGKKRAPAVGALLLPS